MRTAGCHFSHIWIKPPDVSSQHHHKLGWADTLFGWRFSAECDCKQESVSGWETKNWIKADFDSMVALNENPSSHFPPPHSEWTTLAYRNKYGGMFMPVQKPTVYSHGRKHDHLFIQEIHWTQQVPNYLLFCLREETNGAEIKPISN